jgi:DNA invertase Pin-like site-specific DNA recombinase
MSGDSLRRQLQASREYAAKHDLDLDETLRDIGVSAYSGANVENGALGKFLQMVKAGKIAQGSFLIVESLDRLSRKNVLEALPPFLAIIAAGIVVVTLADEQTYSQKTIENNPYQLMGSLVVMIRANDESATKSKRIKEAMTKMRDAAMRGEGRYNVNLPTWIDATKSPKGEINYSLNDHAGTVRLIYELAAEGLGQMEICRRLHRDNVPVFKRAKNGWHQSAVSHLLSYPAVVGTYQPREHRNGRYVDVGPAQKNFYPAAVSEDLYLRAMKAKRTRPARGRKGEEFTNLFQGLVSCGVCSGSMTLYFGRNKEVNSYLRCYNRMRTHKRYDDNKKQFQCDNGSGINYPLLEKAMLDFVPEFRLHELFRTNAYSVCIDTIAKRLIEIDETSKELEAKNVSLIEEISTAPKNLRHLFHAQLNDNSETQTRLEKEQAELEAQRLGILAVDEESADIEKQILEERANWPNLSSPDLYRSRSRIAHAYKRFIDYMTFNPDTQEIMVIVGGGIRAHVFKQGKFVGTFDAVASGHINGRDGSLKPEDFTNTVRRDSDKAAMFDVIKSLIEAKRTASLPNPVNPRLTDPDVIALKAKRKAAIGTKN